MSIVIYISELRPALLDEVCAKHFLIMNNVRTNELKRLFVGGGANFAHASHFVIDAASMNDDADELADALTAVRQMYKQKPVVIIADKEPRGSALLQRLIDKGFYDIVTDLSGGELEQCLLHGRTKEDAAALLSDYPNEPAQAEPEPIEIISSAEAEPSKEKLLANRDWRKRRQFVTVAVCGAENRAGASHHALLIAKFLNFVGFKACYLEANPRRNIVYLANAYAVNANKSRNLLQFEGVDMFFDFKLPDVIAGGHDFFVFDFGAFAETELESFLTKDVRVIIGGSKPWEIPAYKRIFEAIKGTRSGVGANVSFILNFAPKSDMPDLREFVGGVIGCGGVYFSDYAPYPFDGEANRHIYKDIFADYVIAEKVDAHIGDSNAAKSRGIFGLFR
jgi:hypothetical protein